MGGAILSLIMLTGADAWLDGLRERVAADLRAGRPLVVEAHVALCDNSVIRCGGHGLGLLLS